MLANSMLFYFTYDTIKGQDLSNAVFNLKGLSSLIKLVEVTFLTLLQGYAAAGIKCHLGGGFGKDNRK